MANPEFLSRKLKKVSPGDCINDQQSNMAKCPPKLKIQTSISGNITDSIKIPAADLWFVTTGRQQTASSKKLFAGN